MFRDDLGGEGEPQPLSAHAAGHEGVEQPIANMRRNSGPVVLDPHRQREARSGTGEAIAEPKAGHELRCHDDAAAMLRTGLCRVLYQVKEDLNQQIPIAPDGWQRRIVVLAKSDMPGEARGRETPNMIQ